MSDKLRLTPRQRVQKRFEDRMQDQAQRKVQALMQEAVLRACGGKTPSSAEVKERGRTFEIPDTGQLVVQWDGATILMLSPAADGLSWEFMGPAVNPVPKT